MRRFIRLAVSAAALSLALGLVPAHAQTAPKFAVDASLAQGPAEGLDHRPARRRLHGASRTTSTWSTVATSPTRKRKPRSRRPSIIKFDVAGNVVGSWGDQTTVPGSIHGCFVDHDKQRLGRRQWRRHGPEIRAGRKAAAADRHQGKFDSVDGTRRGKGNNSAQDQLHMPSRHRDRSGQRRHLHRRRLRQPPRRRCSTRTANSCASGAGRRPTRKPRRQCARRVRRGGALHRA